MHATLHDVGGAGKPVKTLPVDLNLFTGAYMQQQRYFQLTLLWHEAFSEVFERFEMIIPAPAKFGNQKDVFVCLTHGAARKPFWYRRAGMISFLLSLFFFMLNSAASGVQDVSGTLSGPSVTWSGVIHITGGDVTVPAGTTLMISAGTEVRVQQSRRLLVMGVLRVEGTALSPVIFGPEPGAQLVADPASVGLPLAPPKWGAFSL